MSVVSLGVAPVQATPGGAAEGTVVVSNGGDRALTFTLRAVGLTPGWVSVPATLGPVAPGATGRCTLVVTLPLGHPPSRLLGSIVATPDDGGPAVAVDLVVDVADGATIFASLEPATVRGRTWGRTVLVLRNRGGEAVPVRLGVQTARGLVARLERDNLVLAPGSTARIRTHLRGRHGAFSESTHRNFAVRVQGRGTPVIVDGVFLQRPVQGRWLLKVAAVATVVALWAAVAVVGISALDKRLRPGSSQRATATAPAPPPAAPSAGPGAGAGAVGTGSGPPGSGRPAGGASGSGPTGPGSAPGVVGGSVPTTRASGKVSAGDPGGVTVTLSPTSLVDEQAQAATFASSGGGRATRVSLERGTPIGKFYGTLISDTVASGTTARTTPTLTTTTAPDGSWAFGGLAAPGYYLVTFAKAGYATTRYVITAAVGQPVTLAAAIAPGDGALSGLVRGPAGPLGGVALTVTDGTVTLHTTTPTTGAVGSWAVNGLSTPGTYLVTATAPGYGTQTAVEKLGAGGAVTGIPLVMRAGLGSITGVVAGSRTGAGVGGLTVTASAGSTTLSTGTLTEAPVGAYTLPNLPIPGSYTVTVSGPGYVTQTQSVSLTGNAAVDASIVPATSDVTGVVTDVSGAGLPGAGAVLFNQDVTYKTLTQSGSPVGGFDFGSVPPGKYLLAISDYRHTTQTIPITLAAGEVQHPTVVLPDDPGPVALSGAVQGGVVDFVSHQPVSGATATLDGTGQTASTTEAGYKFTGVSPGIHVIRVDAPGRYESVTVKVAVASGTTSFAPLAELNKLARLGGNAVDSTGGQLLLGTGVVTATLTDSAGATTTLHSVATPTLSGLVPPNEGGFEIDGIAHGSYQLSVSAPGYLPSKLIQVSVAVGVDQVLPPGSIVLNRAPTFLVQTRKAVANGQPVAIGGVTIRAVPSTAAASLAADVCTVTAGRDPATGVVGLVSPDQAGAPPTTVLDGLVDGTAYTITFAVCSAAGVPTLQGPSVRFTAHLNNTTVQTVVLAPVSVTSPRVRLGFLYQGAAHTVLTCFVETAPTVNGCPTVDPSTIAATTVTIDGFSGYDTTGTTATAAPIRLSDAVYSNDATFGGGWTFPDIKRLVPVNGTVRVSASPAFSATVGPLTVEPGGFTVGVLQVQAAPVPVSGSVVPTAGVTFTVAPASTAQYPLAPGVAVPGGGTVTPSMPATLTVTDDGGAIGWHDSNATQGYALPGVYDLTPSDPGFIAPTPVTVRVPLCQPASGTPCQAHVAFGGFTALVALAVTLPADFVPLPGAAAPTAQLIQNAGGARVVVQTLSFTPVAGATVTFAALAPTTPGLSLEVTAPGHVTATLPSIDLTNTATNTLSVTPTLLAFVAVAVHLPSDLVTVPGAPPVLVELRQAAPSGTTLLEALRLPPTGGATGTFRPVDPTLTGLTVDVAVAGYLDASVPVAPSTTASVTPVLVPAAFLTGTVTGAVNGHSTGGLAGATVRLTPHAGQQPNPTCDVTLSAVTDPTGAYNLTATHTSADPASIRPSLCAASSYDIAVSADGWQPGTTTVATPAAVGPAPAPATAATVLAAVPVTQIVRVLSSDPLVPPSEPCLTALSPIGRTVQVGCGGPDTAGTGSSYTPPTAQAPGSFTLQLDPTSYTFGLSENGFEPLVVGPVPLVPSSAPTTPLSVTLSVHENLVAGIAVVDPVAQRPLAGTIDLLDRNGTIVGSGVVGADHLQPSVYRITSTTTGQPLPDGSYTLAVDGGLPAGDTYDRASVLAVSLANASAVTAPIILDPPAPPVSVTVSAISGVGLSGAVVRLDPIAKPSTPPACLSGGDSSSLGAGGLGIAVESAVGTPANGDSGTTAVATIQSVRPDFYALTVTGAGLPTQRPVPVAVCPSAGPVSGAFHVAASVVSGTIVLTGGFTQSLASAVTVAIPGVPAPSVTCSPGDCSHGTFAVTVPDGNYTGLGASLTGYVGAAQDVSPSSLTESTGTVTLTLTPATRTVYINVHSDTASSLPLPSAVVTLGGPGGTTFGPATTTSSGTAVLSGVPPQPNPYAVSVSLPSADLGVVAPSANLSVGLAPANDPGVTLDLATSFGQLTVSPSDPSTTVTGPSPSTGSTAGAGPFLLAPGTYRVKQGSGTVTATVGDGDRRSVTVTTTTTTTTAPTTVPTTVAPPVSAPPTTPPGTVPPGTAPGTVPPSTLAGG